MKYFSPLFFGLILFSLSSCGDSSTKVLEQLRNSESVYTQNAECMLQCMNVSKKEVRAILDSGIVDFEKSNMHGSCPIYIINTHKDDDLQVTVSTCDSMANILDVRHASAKDTCRCN